MKYLYHHTNPVGHMPDTKAGGDHWHHKGTKTLRVLQFRFPYVNTVPVDEPGILALGTVLEDHTPLVLLADLQSRNPGASLTNTAEAALVYVTQHWQLPRSTQWVECDSLGQFDQVIPDWSRHDRLAWPGGPWAPTVEWRPLRFEGHVRSLGAFLGYFGGPAADLWKALWAMVVPDDSKDNAG